MAGGGGKVSDVNVEVLNKEVSSASSHARLYQTGKKVTRLLAENVAHRALGRFAETLGAGADLEKRVKIQDKPNLPTVVEG